MAKVSKQQPKVEFNSSAQTGALLRLKVSRALAFVVVVLPAVLIFGVGFIGYKIGNHATSPSVTANKSDLLTPGNSNSGALRSGAWGTLAAHAITLQIPDEYLKTTANPIRTNSRWVFKGFSRNRILNLFASAGLSAEELRTLSATNYWQVMTNQIVITPPHSVVLGLTPQARSIIYTVLAQFPENALQHSPFFWKTKDEAAFFSNPDLSEPAKTLIRQMSYQKGNLTAFADLETLIATLQGSEAELVKILKPLSAKPATLAKLQITPETDMDAMVRYWGVGGLTKVMEPALEAVTRIPRGRTVTFLAVLPQFARQRLNIYPGSQDNDGMDGIWTAFNFFANALEATNTAPSFWGEKLNTDYFSVFTDPRYGDVLIISRPTGEVVQAGVYLADDLVFTRIGSTRWDPWTIMTVADLQEVSGLRLEHQEIPTISYYRNRSF
ncbi:MAG: hypothetical protein QM813_27295 [Verrucomicrobiota bacterium]